MDSKTLSQVYKHCKVEFNQPFCWLYSVLNLLVIQHLETLYLGENHVRVVCERVWRKAQECALKKGLATRSRDWLATGKSLKVAHVWSMQGSWKVTTAVALQDKISSLTRQLARDSNSRLVPIARPSRQNTLFVRNLTLRIPYTPYYNALIPTKCRELLERILREKP